MILLQYILFRMFSTWHVRKANVLTQHVNKIVWKKIEVVANQYEKNEDYLVQQNESQPKLFNLRLE